MARLPLVTIAPIVVAFTIATLSAACGSPEPIPETPKPAATPEPEPQPEPGPAAVPPAKPKLDPWPTFERPATPPPMTPDGSVANVDTVVNGMGGDLKRCYDRELAENPLAKGSVRLRVQIEPKGDVNSVQLLSQTGNLSASLLRCVAKVVGSRWFLAVGTGASLELPLTLAPDAPRKEP
jgi:hypothetical protein